MSSDGSPRARLLRPPEIGPGPLRELKEAIYELYLGACPATLDQIRARIRDLADGDAARTRRVVERDPEWFDVALAQLTFPGPG